MFNTAEGSGWVLATTTRALRDTPKENSLHVKTEFPLDPTTQAEVRLTVEMLEDPGASSDEKRMWRATLRRVVRYDPATNGTFPRPSNNPAMACSRWRSP